MQTQFKRLNDNTLLIREKDRALLQKALEENLGNMEEHNKDICTTMLALIYDLNAAERRQNEKATTESTPPDTPPAIHSPGCESQTACGNNAKAEILALMKINTHMCRELHQLCSATRTLLFTLSTRKDEQLQ